MVLKKKQGRTIKNITGQRFGLLTAIEPTEERANYNVVWLCSCDCGNITKARSGALQSGNKKSCGCLTKLSEGEASLNYLFDRYKRNAANNKRTFYLTKEEFRNITKQKCHYCGIEPSQRYYNHDYNGDYIYNGIDRVNNYLGYELDNCVPCCFECNKAKSDISYSKYMDWIDRIIKFRGSA